MAAQLAQSVYVNGNSTESQSSTARADQFYEKLLRLHEDVFAGSHPRLKVPVKAGATQQTGAQSFQQNPHSILGSHGGGHRDAEESVQYAPTKNGSIPVSSSPFVDFAPSASAPSNLPTAHTLNRQYTSTTDSTVLNNPTAGFVARGKERESRQLVQAQTSGHAPAPKALEMPLAQNIAIKRNHLEKILRQEFVSLSINGPAPPIPALALETAQSITAPVSGFKSPLPPAPSPSSESFDENSYYSSKANSWSTEHTDVHGNQNDSDAMVVSDDDDLYEPPPQVNASNGLVLDHVPNSNAAIPGLHDPSIQQDWEPEWDDEEDEGDDYEPPAPMAQSNAASATQTAVFARRDLIDGPDTTSQLSRRPIGRHTGPTIVEDRIRSPVSIAVNQIRSPVAPQPSRISPLALGNMPAAVIPRFSGQQHTNSVPIVQHGGRNDQDNSSGKERVSGRESRGTSPPQAGRPSRAKRNHSKADRNLARVERNLDGSIAEPSKKRKRGRTPEEREKKNKKKGKRRAATPVGRRGMAAAERSPEPYIKPEPTSPPPPHVHANFASARGPSRAFRDGAEDDALVSPRIPFPRPVYYSDQDHSPRSFAYAGEDAERFAAPLSVSHRRPERDNQDLRRVASLQYARRPLSPAREYIGGYQPVEARAFEPAPYEVVRPAARGSVFPEAVDARYARRTPSPVYVADPYVRVHSPALMPPPPPRQIIMDQFGNRYYAEPVVETRRSVVPPNHRMDTSPYYDRLGAREPPARAVRVADAYDKEPFHGMLPPARVRAYSHVPDDIAEYRVPRERAFSVLPQETSPRDASQRAYHDHEIAGRPPPPRFSEVAVGAPRAYTVRPEPPRLASGYVSRPGSVIHAADGRYARREAPPPSARADADHRYSSLRAPVPQHRGRYSDDASEDIGRPSYGDGRRVISYGQ